MTNWPPLRAGTPKLSAAGPDRNGTIPSLKVSCAVPGVTNASDIAVAEASVTTRERRLMKSSPLLSRRRGRRFVHAVSGPARLFLKGSLGRLFRPVYRGCSDLRLYVI